MSTNWLDILSDQNNHVGHLVLEVFSRNPDHILQIDAATGAKETNKSALHRSIAVSRCFNNLGLKPGDVLGLAGRNHLDLRIPYYAALMNGMSVAGIDPFYKYDEIKHFFELTNPKIVFCESENLDEMRKAADDLGLDARFVTFGDGECGMKEFIKEYGDTQPGEEFRVANIDGDKYYAFLVATSGTSGTLKIAALRHKAILSAIRIYIAANKAAIGNGNYMNLSPVQWVSGFCYAIIMPAVNSTLVQTSASATPAHIIDIINEYRPVAATVSPGTVTQLLKHPKKCDFTCFKQLILTGSKVYEDVMIEMRARTNEGVVVEMYGMTETLGPVLAGAPDGPLGNCGKEVPFVQVKLVDPETHEEVTEPRRPGEMWLKKDGTADYYNMPEETARCFSADGWYKTGDLLYRDEQGYYFYVDKLRMFIKYKGYTILPTELEELIRVHPGVEDVAVTSIPNPECGELPVACVIRRPGSRVNADEINQTLIGKLSNMKQLHGGVVFLDSLPHTSTGKIARGKLRALAAKSRREPVNVQH